MSLCVMFVIPGKPCKDSFEETHPDWAPTIFPCVLPTSATPKNVERSNRIKKRKALCALTTQSLDSIMEDSTLLVYYKTYIQVT